MTAGGNPGRQAHVATPPEQDAPPAKAQRAQGRHVLEILLPQDLAPDEPGIGHPADRADGEEDVHLPWTEKRDDGDDEDHNNRTVKLR